MGLFSSKKVTTVGTSVTRVMQDSMLPNAIQAGVLRAIVEGQATIPEYLMEEVVGSIATKADQAYRYGQTDYSYGLPSGEVVSNTQGRTEVRAVLDTLMGGAVLTEYIRFGPPNNLHIAWMKVMSDYGYDPVTNQLAVLTAAKGTPVYLQDLQSVVPEAMEGQINPAMVQQFGIPPTAGYTPLRRAMGNGLENLTPPSPIILSDTATEVSILMTVVWTGVGLEGTTTYPTQQITIDVTTDYDDVDDYFHAKYTYEGQTYYWMYRVGDGTYPVLDSFFDSAPIVSGEYYPFLYFRFNKQRADLNPSSIEYKTSKRLAKYFGMHYQELIDAIHENPDIDDVEQAMCIMAVPANSTNPIELKYLYDYFENLFEVLDIDNSQSYITDIVRTMFARSVDPILHTTVIQDARFKMSLTNAGLYKARKVGNLGPVGTCTGATGTVDFVYTSESKINDGVVKKTMTVPCQYYRKQISDVLYEEIQVINLQTIYHIFNQYTAIGDEDDLILLVPLDRTITKNYEFRVRETLYARSLHFVFNSRIVTKVKWYQQEWFRDLLIIVAVVIMVLSWGSTYELLAAALAVGTITVAYVVLTVIIGILKYLAVMALVKLFVRIVGVEAAFIVAIIATVAGVAIDVGASAVGGAPWAQELLALSSNLVSGIEEQLAEMLGDLAGQASAFDKEVKESLKTLETAQDLLENRSLLSPYIIFGETPDDFYKRTVHSGNIGVVGLGAIPHYVEMALTLPKASDSLGDLFYV